MRLKLDENLPEDARLAALALGHDVDTILDEALGGSSDPDVLAAAIAIESQRKEPPKRRRSARARRAAAQR